MRPPAVLPASDLIDVIDVIDQIVGLEAGSPVHQVRQQRDKVTAATQGSYHALLDLALPGLSLIERLLVALLACRLTPAPALAAHYEARLREAGANSAWIACVAHGELDAAEQAGSPLGARLRAVLHFSRTLIERPVEGDRQLLHTLLAAGLSTPEVVALAQWVAFLSYQTRLVAGLQAMRSAELATDLAPPLPTPATAGTAGTASGAAPSTPLVTGPIVSHGFTNATLGWKAWLPVVDPQTASAEQIAVLEESHPAAKVSDYYLLLVQQPEILRERSTAFNAIMYAPGGLPRAERELSATVVSRLNGCVYCASVHAQRFEQLAKRNDVIVQLFENPRAAGTTARERVIAAFSVLLTEAPGALEGRDVHRLQAAGLRQLEVLDLVHSVAIFAWANRLMLTLGGPVHG